MHSPLNKVCIKHECGWRSHCNLYEANNHVTQTQYIVPEFQADACHHYSAKKADWIQGRFEVEAND